MAWTVGTAHNLSGLGQVTINQPVALAIAVSSYPANAGIRAGVPPTLHGLGRLALGNSSGFRRDLSIVHPTQIEVLDFRGFTTLGYTFEPGAAATVTELQGVNDDTTPLMPWDRAAAAWNQSNYSEPAGGLGTVTAWTYTVPAGKKLWLTSAVVWAQRRTVATTAVQTVVEIAVGSARLCLVVHYSNVVGDKQTDAMHTGGLILEAGKVITGVHQTNHTAGTVGVHLAAAGFTFDA